MINVELETLMSRAALEPTYDSPALIHRGLSMPIDDVARSCIALEQLVRSGNGCNWVINLIDGTHNFARGSEHWAAPLWTFPARPPAVRLHSCTGARLADDRWPRPKANTEWPTYRRAGGARAQQGCGCSEPEAEVSGIRKTNHRSAVPSVLDLAAGQVDGGSGLGVYRHGT